MEKILLCSIVLLYFISSVSYVFYIFRNEMLYARVGRYTLFVGFILQFLVLAIRYSKIGDFPFAGMFDSLSFFVLMMILLYLLIELKGRFFVLGAFVSPLAFVFMLVALLFWSEVRFLPPVLRSYWLPMHTLTSFIGEAAFAISFILSVVYLIQEKELRSKRYSFIFRRLPPLAKVDGLNYFVLKIGFVFLTLGIVTGSVWAYYAWGSYWSWDPKETWSLVTWLLYAAILHARLTVGWRGRKAAILSIVGFISVLFLFLGVNLLLPGLHSYAR